MLSCSALSRSALSTLVAIHEDNMKVKDNRDQHQHTPRFCPCSVKVQSFHNNQQQLLSSGRNNRVLQFGKEYIAYGEKIEPERSKAEAFAIRIPNLHYHCPIQTKHHTNDENLLKTTRIYAYIDHKPAHFLCLPAAKPAEPRPHDIFCLWRYAFLEKLPSQLQNRESQTTQSRHTNATYLAEYLRRPCTLSYALLIPEQDLTLLTNRWSFQHVIIASTAERCPTYDQPPSNHYIWTAK